jgi:hypothetical protein
MPRYQIIVNQHQEGEGLRSVPAIKQYFDDWGGPPDICLTERPWHAVEITQASVVADMMSSWEWEDGTIMNR